MDTDKNRLVIIVTLVHLCVQAFNFLTYVLHYTNEIWIDFVLCAIGQVSRD